MGQPAWNKGNDWRATLAQEELRAINAEKMRRWRARNKDHCNALARERMASLRATDPMFKIHANISRGIRASLGREKRRRGWELLVGYTTEELVERLIATMPAGYTMDDYLAGRLQIDHIIPRIAYSFESAEDPGFRACWALSNLQLLTEHENKSKGSRLDHPSQVGAASQLA